MSKTRAGIFSDLSSFSDDKLMEKICKGQQAAFEEIFSRYNLLVSKYTFRVTRGNRAQAEDLLQEIWLKVITKCNQYQAQNCFKGWLFTIVRNHSQNMIRSQKTRKETPLFAVESIESGMPSLEKNLIEKLNIRNLNSEIEGLPETQKRALIAWLDGEKGQKKVANDLGLSHSAFISLVYRARKTLMKRLSER